MSSTCMMAVEGVLGGNGEFSVSMMPNDEGRSLFAALSQVYRMVLVTSESEEHKVVHWLRGQGIADADQVVTRPGWYLDDNPSYDTVDIRAGQLRTLRASRAAVTLLVDSDPLVVVHAMSVGITGLLYGAPRPASGRLDLARRKVRDWSSIEAELDLQRGLREEEEVV